MTFVPTTTMKLEGPSTTTDSFGDPVETWETVEDYFPAAYAQRRKKFWNPVEQRQGTMVWGEALLPATLAVEAGQRLHDSRSGLIHHVVHVHRPQNVVAPGAFLRVETTAPSQEAPS